MCQFKFVLLLSCIYSGVISAVSDYRVVKLNSGTPNAFEYLAKEKYVISDNEVNSKESVYLQLFYECLCPGCRMFDTTDFIDVVKKLHSYIKIDTYPYGNAIINSKTGEVECQHGPIECYGNMLHACALDIIPNKTTALIFNSCMMDPNYDPGSDDKSADECGKQLSIDDQPIKTCAKSDRGKELLKHYGEQTDKQNIKYTPYVVLNGMVISDKDNFNLMKSVCSAFKEPPPPCNGSLISNKYTKLHKSYKTT